LRLSVRAWKSTLKYLVITALLLLQPELRTNLLFGQVPPLLHSGEASRSPIEMKADSQEKHGDAYHLAGAVKVVYEAMSLQADTVDYDSSSGAITAAGNVRFERSGKNELIEAERAEYNLKTGVGRFFNARGSLGGLVRRSSSILTSANPIYFKAATAQRDEQGEYTVFNAEVTVCDPNDPTWTFSSGRSTILPESSAVIHGATLRVLRIPVLYLPILYKSLGLNPRNSGFLAPSIGKNSRFGFVLGDSFYWAINRSMDAELGGEYLSARGWSQQGNFRAVLNNSTHLSLAYFGVVDRGFGPDKVDQGGRSARAEGVTRIGPYTRGVLDFNYLSSLTFREAFSQTYTEAVSSEIHSFGFLSRNEGPNQLNAYLSRTENFQSLQPNDAVRLKALPRLDYRRLEQPAADALPFWLAFDASAGLISRTEPSVNVASGLKSSLFERIELFPRVSLPLRFKGSSLETELGFRATHYGNSKEESLLNSSTLTRGVTSLNFDWHAPAVSKTFTSGGWLSHSKVRHVVEPAVKFSMVSGAGDFREILVYDEQDIVTNTRQLEYSLTNRILASRPEGIDELLSFEIKQQYYFKSDFGGALITGSRNVFLSSLTLTGSAFLDQPRRFSPLLSYLRLKPAAHLELEVREDYDPELQRFSHGGIVGSLHSGPDFLSISHSFVRSSPALAAPANQIGFSLGHGNLTRVGWNAVVGGAYDVRSAYLQYMAFQGSYNNNCCGISVEFRRFALGPARNENQFRVAFSLANIGTFGTLKKQERMF
jgi:LPS-assembly protein